MADTRGMLARLRKLERSRGAGDEMREWLVQAFDAAIADGRICPVDGYARSMAMWCGAVF